MTKDQFIAFQPFEKQLVSARNTNHARFPHQELIAFGAAVEKWRGDGLRQNEKSCPHCLLTLLKAVAVEYFKYKESPKGKALLKAQNGTTETTEDRGDSAGE